MTTRAKPFVFAVACILCGLAGCAKQSATLPYYVDESLTPTWPAPDEAASPAFHRIPEFRLVDQAAQPFTADSLDGRVHVASFFFATCSDICPKTRRQLKEIAREFANDDRVLIASYSVNPERDSVAALKAFANHNSVDHRRWRLLTGERRTIQSVAKSYLIGTGKGADYGVDSVAHTEMIALVDQDRHIRGVYNGTLRLETKQLVTDIRELLETQRMAHRR